MRREQLQLDMTLTPEGLESLREELERLVTEERRAMAERLRVAYETGAEEPGGEVAEARREQDALEARIRRLEERLAAARVADPGDRAPGVAGVGRRVSLRRLSSGRLGVYRLVGPPESDPRRALLSTGSPLGRAVLGRRAGEVVRVEGPGGAEDVRIEAVDEA